MSDFELLGPDTISFSNVSVYGNLEEDFSQDYLESHLGTDRTLQSGHERQVPTQTKPKPRQRRHRSAKLNFGKKIKRKRHPPREFTYQEDSLILQLVAQIGPKFKRISAFFQGRQKNILKNRYYKVLRKRDTPPLNSYRAPKKIQPFRNPDWVQSILGTISLERDMYDIMKTCLSNVNGVFQRINEI